MKKFLLLALFAIASTLMSVAQDVIITKDGQEIKAKVSEVLTTQIKYKKYESPDGPLYTVNKEDLLLIRYENGNVEVMNQEAATGNGQTTQKQAYSADNDPCIEFDGSPCIMGASDAKIFYDGGETGASVTALVSFLTGPIIGLIPAIVNSTSEISEGNLGITRSYEKKLMTNADYADCYYKQAKKEKSKNNWLMWGVGSLCSCVWIPLLLVL